MTKIRTPAHIRALAMISIDPETGCWPFSGARTKNGYGKIYIPPASGSVAHRVVFAALRWPIPDDMELDHTWDKLRCCER